MGSSYALFRCLALGDGKKYTGDISLRNILVFPSTVLFRPRKNDIDQVDNVVDNFPVIAHLQQKQHLLENRNSLWTFCPKNNRIESKYHALLSSLNVVERWKYFLRKNKGKFEIPIKALFVMTEDTLARCVHRQTAVYSDTTTSVIRNTCTYNKGYMVRKIHF